MRVGDHYDLADMEIPMRDDDIISAGVLLVRLSNLDGTTRVYQANFQGTDWVTIIGLLEAAKVGELVGGDDE